MSIVPMRQQNSDKMTVNNMSPNSSNSKDHEQATDNAPPADIIKADGDEAPMDSEEKPKRKCNYIGWAIRIAIAVFIIAFIVYAIIDRKRVLSVLESFIIFIRDYPYIGPLLIVVAYIIATVLFLPGLVLTLGSGFALN